MVILQVENLSVRYPARCALSAVSFGLNRGEVLALVGPNGSGKSSLLRAISGALPACEGRVLLAGQNVQQLRPAQRARQMAVVPQNALIPPAFTALETVLFGRTPYLNFLGQISSQDEQIARDSLTRVEALALADRRMGELSGGEQQRVLLARALAQQTPILLLDEPTTHLDLKHQVGLLRLTRSLAHHDGLAALIVLHDLNLAAQYADRIALLNEGRLLALGAPASVFTSETLSTVYGLPLNVLTHPTQNHPLVAA